MDPNEDWSGNSQVLENKAESNENEIENVNVNEVIPGYTSFHDYVQEAFGAMKLGIKVANNLPVESNFDYYSCFPSFLKAKEENGQSLLKLMQQVLGIANVNGNISNRNIEEKFDLLLEANDFFQDRVNALMDEECGITKNTEVELLVTRAKKPMINGSWNNQVCGSLKGSENEKSVRLLAGKNIQRPQLTFKDKIDNSPNPWCPRIKEKPNSLKPLAIYMEEGKSGEMFSHPYEYELDMFVTPNDQLKKSEPLMYKSLEETEIIMIKDPSDIKLLLEDLKRYKELAVDLEHHSYRSFQGITCLMQISTRDTDYLIDTLSLRSELHQLNEIFTKPTVLKVFHGADLDVQWLQRDLSLYVVNMFDTHQAAKQLNLPYLSLAYLLKLYCNVNPDKHFQMADWRIRPLPEELIKYAREDTHYLLYIKDILKNSLVDAANGQTNILKAVYDRSKEICEKTYVKPVWTEESFMNMYRKSQKMFNNKQLYALRELHKWRDHTAREEDDSTAYVLPNHMLLNMAETLPREMQGILACCDSIPPLVRQNLLKLHKIILKAREQPLIKPILEELRQRLTQRPCIGSSKSWIYSPHDMPSDMEARADLPCLLDLLGKDNVLESSILKNAKKHMVTVFDSPSTSENEEELEKVQNPDESLGKSSKKKRFVFVSPFERYKRVIPMVAEAEAQEREKQKIKEENRLNKLKEEEVKIIESKSRVYEHFKRVSQETVSNSISKPSEISMNQMHGCKRKRDSKLNESSKTKEEKIEEDQQLLTPTHLLEGKRTRRGKRKEDSDVIEASLRDDQNVQETKNTAKCDEQDWKNETIASSIHARKKGDKKRTVRDLKRNGMMPSEKFDYNVVDFSSFQGGSKNTSNQVHFDQTIKQKKEKTRRRKKQKLAI